MKVFYLGKYIYIYICIREISILYALWEHQCYNLKSINNVKTNHLILYIFHFVYLVYIWIGNFIVPVHNLFNI